MNKDELIEEAKGLGLEPHPNTGELKLKRMIDDEYAKGEVSVVELAVPSDKIILNRGQKIAILRKKQMKLVRVIARNNDDMKKEWAGETYTIICAAGTVKKYVPFDNKEGWHVPQCILDVMRARMCTKYRKTKLKNGQEHSIAYQTKSLTIEVMKPLTEKEIGALATEQKARGSID